MGGGGGGFGLDHQIINNNSKTTNIFLHRLKIKVMQYHFGTEKMFPGIQRDFFNFARFQGGNIESQ